MKMVNPIQSPKQYAETLYKAGYRATNSQDSNTIVEGLKNDYGFLNYNYSLEVLSELEEIEFFYFKNERN
tara:strand:- start:978 stop:1187 length:210 start_codon:yes stop_codon:yes gene_type:complete